MPRLGDKITTLATSDKLNDVRNVAYVSLHFLIMLVVYTVPDI